MAEDKKYSYALVVRGEVEARDDQHARLQVEMGFALLGRLLKTPHVVGLTVNPAEAEGSAEAEVGNGTR